MNAKKTSDDGNELIYGLISIPSIKAEKSKQFVLGQERFRF